MWEELKFRIRASFKQPGHIAPLVFLRITFGAVLLFGVIRFMLRGWVTEFYVRPQFHFTFYGFGWVKPFGAAGMYILFGLMALAALFIIMGLVYRTSTFFFFVSFTYVELIDKTYYLNHYYFVSLVVFLMLLVPANRYFSLDVWRKPSLQLTQVPGWTIGIFKLQLFIVYFFAGLSKLTHDWMLEAMPLKIWLPANSHLPLIGGLLEEEWIAYAFSWFGAVFDLSIVFFLSANSTRRAAYVVVILFHVFTAWFFKIGLFPYIMICMTLIFFPGSFHLKMIWGLQRFFGGQNQRAPDKLRSDLLFLPPLKKKLMLVVLFVFFLFQILFPMRYLLYPGNLLWTEEGYRFSWRVMLMEKSGTIFFYVKDPQTGKSTEVINTEFLTPFQEKMMATQPDMILQYAHYLESEYKKRGIANPVVTAESYVTLNGSGSRPLVNNTVDLTKEKESFGSKAWVLPFRKQEKN